MRVIAPAELDEAGQERFQNLSLTEDDITRSTLGTFTVKTFAATYTELENGQLYNCYHIAQNATFAPDYRNISDVQRYLIESYTMSAWPINFAPNVFRLPNKLYFDHTTEQLSYYSLRTKAHHVELKSGSKPEVSTGGTRTVSSEISFGLNANIAPTGGLGINFGYSHSKSFNIPDINILNQQCSDAVQQNNATWQFELYTNKDSVRTSNVSRASFEPYIQWVWRVPQQEDSEGLNFISKLGIQFKHYERRFIFIPSVGTWISRTFPYVYGYSDFSIPKPDSASSIPVTLATPSLLSICGKK